MPYKIVPVNIGRGDQFTDDFLRINPNHRMPAMVDHEPQGRRRADQRVRVRRDHDVHRREGGPVLAAGRARASTRSPSGSCGRWPTRARSSASAAISAGSATARATRSYAVRRFTDEANRLYGVLNNRLYDRRYLAGDEYTIADMISYPWTVNWKVQGQDIERVQVLQALVRGDRRAPGGAEGHGGRRRPVERRHQAAARGAGADPQDALQPARPAGEGRVIGGVWTCISAQLGGWRL